MKFLTLIFGAALISAGGAGATTLFSDDFDSNTPGPNTTPAGWSLSVGQVDLTGPGYFPEICSATGDRCIDLDGSGSSAGTISTVQSFQLLTGGTYTLSFDYSWNWFQQQNPNTMTFGVGAFTDTLTTNGRRPEGQFRDYETLSFSFAGNGSAGSIFFAHEGNDFGGIVIDNVMLTEEVVATPAVPLPAGLPLLLAGLGGLAFLRRRKG